MKQRAGIWVAVAALSLVTCARLSTNDSTQIVSEAERTIALAQGHNGLVDINDAIRMLTTGIKRYPNDGQLYVSLALAYSVRSDQDRDASLKESDRTLSDAILAQALRIQPNLASAYVFRASTDFIDHGCIPCAEADLDRAAKMQDRPFAHVVRSEIASNRGDYKGAEQELLKGLAVPGPQIPSTIASVYWHLAWLYAYQLNEPDRADWAYRRGLAMLPESGQLHVDYAWFLLFTKGKVDDALRECKAAIDLKDPDCEPTYAMALYAKWAQSYALTADSPGTRAAWSAATAVMPADGNVVAFMSDSVALVSTLRALLKSGALKGQNLNVLNEAGNTPLISALSIASWVPDHNLPTVRLLLEAGADPNLYGRTATLLPLFTAVQSNDVPLTKLLLQHGARVNPTGQLMASPIFQTVMLRKLEMTRLLIAKANPDDRIKLIDFATKMQNWQALQALGQPKLAARIRDGFVVAEDWHVPGIKKEVITSALKAAHIPYQEKKGNVWVRGRDNDRASKVLNPIRADYVRTHALQFPSHPGAWPTMIAPPPSM